MEEAQPNQHVMERQIPEMEDAWNDRDIAWISLGREAIMMTGDKGKWDGSKPRLPEPENDEKDRQEKKPGDKGLGLEGPSKDSEDAKHDGP